MLSNPLVSIAIVTWNRREDLSKAIESCRSQTYENIEIVVADNASSDGTYEFLVESHPDIKVVRIHRNLGCCPGRNLAMANCSGEIVFCFDDDGFLDSECIERIVADFQLNSDVAVVACNVQNPSESDYKPTGADGPISGKSVPIFLGTGFGIRKDVLDGVGYFPDYFRQGEENYLSMRVLDAGYKIFWNPAAFIYHRWEDDQKGRSTRQILYLNFRHELENIKRLLPFRYALPLLGYRVLVNLARRYLRSGYLRLFIPDLIRVLPIMATDYKESKIKIDTYRWFTKEASQFFKDRESYVNTMPLSQ
jgi:GT2 family glycosyltransferase